MRRSELKSRGLMGFSDEDYEQWRKEGIASAEKEERLRKKREAEAHKRAIELEEMKQSGLGKRQKEALGSARSLAELTQKQKTRRGSAEGGLSFSQRRSIHTDAQRYVESLRDIDTKEIKQPKTGRILTEKEVENLYINKAAELENIYLGGRQPGTAPRKEPMVVTGDVTIGGKKIAQQDLKQIMGLRDEDVMFREGYKPPKAAQGAPAPAPDLKNVAPLLSPGKEQPSLAVDLPSIAGGLSQGQAQPAPTEETTLKPSLKGTIARTRLPAKKKSVKELHFMSLPEIMKKIKSFVDYKPHFMSLPEIYGAGKTKIGSLFD